MIAGSEPWPLVGRDDELAVLDRVLDELRGGRVLEISGEPGIGKTTLLAELTERARARGLLVLAGRATEFEHEVPFGLFADALDDHLANIDGTRLEQLLGDGERILPAERYRLHRAIRTRLDELAGRRGLVLVLDDTHWADPATVEALVHLVRHPPRNRVLVAVSARTGRQPALLAAALAAAERAAVVQLALGPLPVDAVATLIGAAAGSARCRHLHDQSSGNPFYLQALVTTERGTAAPPTVHAVLVAELEALTPMHRLVAHAAAVAGDPFPPELAASIAGLELGETLEALDDLIARDLLRPGTDRHRFHFRHPLVRNTTYASSGPGWRRAAHARAATALEHAPRTVRAHHVAESARAGDSQAIELLLDAAADTMPSSPIDAAHWLDIALPLLTTHDPRRPALQLRRARALFVGGALTECRDLLLEMLANQPPDATSNRLDAVTLCATAQRYLGQHTEARRILRTELEALPAADDLSAAALKIELTACELTQLITPDLRLLDEALETAARHGDDALRLAALSMRSFGVAMSGAIPEAWGWLDAATELVEGVPDVVLAQRLDGLVWLCFSAGAIDRAQEMLRYADRGIRLAREVGNTHSLPEFLLTRAHAFVFLGPIDQALASCEDALDAALLTPNISLHIQALATKAWAAAFGGELDIAMDAARRAFATPGAYTHLWSAFALGALLEASYLMNRLPTFVEQIIQNHRDQGDPDFELLAGFIPYSLAQLALLQGNLEEALARAEHVEAVVKDELPVNEALAMLIRSDVLRIQGHREVPAACARRAAEIFDHLGFTPLAANAHLIVGRALAADGDVGGAVEAFERSRERSITAKTTWFHNQAVRELRCLGRRVPATTRSAGTSITMTAREHEIAALIAKGHSNKQIADDLVLSVRTVTTHVSNILTKLAVPSRAGVAHALTRPGDN